MLVSRERGEGTARREAQGVKRRGKDQVMGWRLEGKGWRLQVEGYRS